MKGVSTCEDWHTRFQTFIPFIKKPITMNIIKNLTCMAAFLAMSQVCGAQTDVTLAH